MIAAVREGDLAAYGVLYARHLGAARRVAAAVANNPADRDDLVAESFARVLRALRAGRGPSDTFRAYLLTTLRNSQVDRQRRNAAITLTADVPEAPLDGRSGPRDPVDARLHSQLAATAFTQLPHRWRLVLWHTEVENRPPTEVAAMLSLTPNGVAALAYRAREALRQAYLDQYVPPAPPRACRPVVKQLPAWVRDKVTRPAARRIATHLDCCAGCRDLATDLRRLNQELPSMLGPVLAGVPLVLASLAGTAGTLTAGGGVVEGTSTGLSIMTWAGAAKSLVAGATVVATATLGTVTPAASPDVVSKPTADERGITVPDKATRPAAPGNQGHHGNRANQKPKAGKANDANGHGTPKREANNSAAAHGEHAGKKAAKEAAKAPKKAAKEARHDKGRPSQLRPK